MAKTLSTLLGAVFILVGIVGFVSPGFMGTHLSLLHNCVHIVSGAIALYFGLAGSLSGARMFCLVFGAVYLLLGVVGWFAGGADQVMSAGMHGMSPDPKLLKIIPGQLELGQMDHIVHVLLGVVFLAGGVLTKGASSPSSD